ncbi:MAG: protease pro-enzyme activation domain-containing protein [Candidatus Competibacter sp.]|nr:protease pro-enzyme activation domain-containing protein [Candidatus Competibacter sp.]
MWNFLVGILCAFLLLVSPWARSASSADPGSNSDKVALTGHVLPALSAAQPIITTMAAPLAAEPLTLTVVLRRSDPAGFENYLRDVYDPQSPQYRNFMNPEEVSDQFGPSQADYDAVRTYFEQQGFTVAEGSANRMTITVAGTRSMAEKALDVGISDYALGERQFFANTNEPALPKAIAGRVQSVVGLSDLARPSRQNDSRHQVDVVYHNGEGIKKAFCPVVVFLYNLWEGPGNWWVNTQNQFTSFWNAQWEQYNKSAGLPFTPDPLKPQKKWICDSKGDAILTNSSGGPSGGGGFAIQLANSKANARAVAIPNWLNADGTGQRIGLVEFDTFALSDVTDFLAFEQRDELIANLSQVHVGGGATPGPDQAEVLLDIDFILPFVSGARVVVYDAPFTGAGSFQAVFNRMIGDGMTIISNSWSYCEDQTTLADVQSIDSILATAAASGISVFNASGDTGSTCLNGSPNTIGVPAGSPNATAVGGSSTIPGPGSLYQSETWWDGLANVPPTGQGGFGVSRFFSRPSYQNGFTSSTMRSVPDVVANADPYYGIQICQASAGGCPSPSIWGGTSMAAPAWAAYTALLNQAQGSNLGFLNPLLYPLAGTNGFHSAASMGSDFAHVGLGSPNVNVLHVALTGKTLGPASADLSAIYPIIRVEDVDTAAQLGGVPADGTTPFYVAAVLRDANGNTLSGKTVSLSANPAANVAITPAGGITNIANGAVVFTVTSTAIQDVSFSARVLGDNVILAAPNPVSFVAPPAASGSISANPTSVLNNGTSTTTITVTLKDAQNRPSPGKLITLSQGNGHSVITGPSPSVTDVNGQIQFVATNQFSETVIYTAVDVTDGNLPVPGSASVTFGGSATQSCVGAPPTAANGYTLTPFANGFFAQNFFFGNVNWGGCPGASTPAFDTTGSVFIANFRTGGLYKMGSQGGVASNELSNLGETLGQPVFGKDGRLYATHGATTGGNGLGNIVEIDPATGAQLRVVVANLTCPNGLAVDPLSGDLFFDNSCNGGGLNDARLFRVNPSNANPTVEVYATLPTTVGNGAISFAPDGTIYVVTNYFTYPNAPVVRINGTNKPSPTITPLGLNALYWVTVGEVRPDGSAKSLIVLSGTDPNFALALVDITTNPFTSTPLTDGAIGSGVIGPDGCLYASASDTVYKLAPSTGGCGFATTNPTPALTLSPAVVSPNPSQGDSQSFTVTFTNVDAPAGTAVFFQIDGANQQTKLAKTDASGKATITYSGIFSGVDTVTARATVGALSLVSNSTSLNWGPGKHTTFLSLNTSPTSSTAGAPVTLAGGLFDVSANPNAVIAGASIQFAVGGQTCNGITNASGIASCTVTLPTAGSFTLTANYAGTTQFVPASASQAFFVVAPSTAPSLCFTGTLSGGGQATACIIDAPLTCRFTNASFVPVASIGVPPPTGIQIPYDLFQFAATGCGDFITLSVTYPAALPANTSYWKFGPTTGQAAHWYPLAATVNGSTLAVILTDGGAGDSDLRKNGSIVDPGGAGYAAIDIPTLDEWWLTVLALLMATLGAAALQMRQVRRL